MRILHIIFSLYGGGSENLLIDTVNEQVKSEEVTVIIINDCLRQSLINEIDKRVKVVLLNRKPQSKNPFVIIRLNYLLFRIKPNVIHIHHLSISKIICRNFHKRLFYTIHALNIPMALSKYVKCMIAISNAVKENTAHRTNTPIITIPNGINTDKIRHKFHKDIDKEETFKIIQLGELNIEIKGQDILIEAISILRNKGINNISVDFIGDGKDRMSLEKLTKEMGLCNNIKFLGQKNRDYIYSNLKDYDLMCHPSRSEGFGLVIAEGLAAGLPILVPDAGGPYEVIERGKYGCTFTNENAEDCAAKIEYIMNNYKEVSEKYQDGRKYVIEKYSIRKMTREYINVYKENLK